MSLTTNITRSPPRSDASPMTSDDCDRGADRLERIAVGRIPCPEPAHNRRPDETCLPSIAILMPRTAPEEGLIVAFAAVARSIW
jgi:hypothetical protein